MGFVELCELALALGGIRGAGLSRSRRLAVSPLTKDSRGHAGRLQRVDPLDHPGEEPGRIATDLVAAKGQLIAPLQQQRQALGGVQALEEGIDTGLRGVLAKQAHGRHPMGMTDDLLEGPPHRLFGT